jgi:hypothetical protein
MPQDFSQAFPDTMGDFEDVLAYLKPGPDEHVVASFPVIFPDDTEMRWDEQKRFLNDLVADKAIRGLIFAVVPGAADASEAIKTFYDTLITDRSDI